MGLEERIFLHGAAGNIEVAVSQPATPHAITVIAHPHPLFGGTMDNKVVTTLEKAFIELHHAVLRFNFRGVGASEGAHDEGQGETEDTLAVIAYARQKFGTLPLTLAGFSFGGGIMLRVRQRLPEDEVKQLVLIAPSMKQIGGTSPPQTDTSSTLVIHGDADDTVPLTEVMNWAKPQGLPVVVIPGGEHFFHGRLVMLRSVVQRWAR